MTNYPFACDDEIVAIGCGLIDRTLPKAAWTHGAHFAATIWLLSTHGTAAVSRELPAYIRAFNKSIGGENTDTSGYHETITQASIRAAAHWLSAHPGQPLYMVCNALMASRLGSSKWLLAYWSHARLFSVEARRAWVDPDLQILTF